MNFKNEKLYAAMRTYVAAAIEFVTQQAQQAEPTAEIDEEFDLYWITTRYSSDLSQIPEYSTCLHELTDDQVINKHLDQNVGSYSSGAHIHSASRMMIYVLDLGRSDGQYTFDPERFDHEYSFFEETFYSESLICEAIAPLQGLLLDIPIVPLSKGLEICQLREEEMRPYRTPGSHWDSKWCAVRAKYHLPKIIGSKEEEGRFEKIKEEQAIEDQINERIEDVVNALRLFGKCDVYHSGIIHKSSKWLPVQSHSVANRTLGSGFLHYQFNEDEARVFTMLWNKLEHPTVKRTLGTVIRRFSYSCVRHLDEDKIIDLMIAAEALFLRGSKEGEKRFRLALLAGLFLGTTSTDQRNIFQHIKRSYDLRSGLVHGDKLKLKPQDWSIQEFIGKTGDYIQAAIFKAINLLADSENIKSLDNEYWDSLIFR